MRRLPELPRGIRSITNAELERLERAYPDLPRSPRNCVTCRGTGTFRWWDRWDPDRDFPNEKIVEYECPCKDQWLAHLHLLSCGILHAYQTLAWDDMIGAPLEAREQCNKYLNSADSYVDAGLGMIFYGDMGNGKTGLSTLVAKGLIARGYDVYFTTFSAMLDMVQASWRDADERAWFVKRIRNAKVLIIDDIGREHRISKVVKEVVDGQVIEQGTKTLARPVAESTLDEVLRHRVGSRRPTIVTTNFNPEQLGTDYGLGAMNLLLECSIFQEFRGESFRPKQSDRNLFYAENGMKAPIVVEL